MAQTEAMQIRIEFRKQTNALKEVINEVKVLQGAIQGFGSTAVASVDKAGQSFQKAAAVMSDQAARKNLLLTQISLRDFGSSMVIQAQQIRSAINTILQGFSEFEVITQQITVLDSSMKGMRQEVATAAGDIAIKFGLTLIDTATSLRDVVALGIDFEDALQVLDIAAQGAAAGVGTLASASSLLITTQRQFGIGIEDSASVMAKLVFIANETAFNIDDMSTAFSYAGPAAAQLGFAVEDTAAALSLMRDAGLDASTSGTILRQFIQRITSPTSEAREAMEELGIEVADEEGNFKDLTTILSETFDAMEGLTQVERAEAQATIFELRGQQLLNVARSRGLDHLDTLIDGTEQFNDKQIAEAFLSEKSGEALNTLTKELNATKARTQELDFVLAQSLIPSEIQVMNATNKLKEIMVGLPAPMRNFIGATMSLAASAGQAFGQTTLLIVNLFTISKQIPGMIDSFKKMSSGVSVFSQSIGSLASEGQMSKMRAFFIMMKTGLTTARLAAIGAGLAIGGTVTAMIAMQEKDSTMRNVLIALTALQWGFAAASLAAAAGVSGAQAGLVGLIAAGITIAGLLVAINAGVGQASQQKFEHGGLIRPRPGVGISAIIGEGVHPEIVSPVPMMRETVREVIREEKSGGNIIYQPILQQSAFGKIDHEAIMLFNKENSRELKRLLRNRGALIR